MFFSAAKAENKPLTFDEAKAHYIVEMIKQIYWPNDSKLKKIRIGIYGDEQKIVQAFNQKFQHKTIRKKSLSIELIPALSADNTNVQPVVAQYELIYIHNEKLPLLRDMINKYPQALIITDGTVDHDLRMLSFHTGFEEISIKLNLDALHRKGFVVSTNLLLFAGNKTDLVKQLKVKDDTLVELFDDVEKQENQLNALKRRLSHVNEQLDEKTLLLAESKKLLVEGNQQLKVSQLGLEASKVALSSLQETQKNIQEDIKLSQNQLAEKQKIIAEQESKLTERKRMLQALKQHIEISKSKLTEQMSRIKVQKSKISQQVHVISEQRSLLYFAILVILAIIIFAIVLWHINRLRKRSNFELKLLNEQLYELATTDSMTKLFNRRHFLENSQIQVTQLQRTHTNGAVIMIDIDYFKKVNDNHGHAMGDKALIHIANMLKDNLRSYDILGRLGGEEFAMFLTNCPIDKAHEISDRLREKIAASIVNLQGYDLSLTVSMGITEVNDRDFDIERVLQRADNALYQAKEQGRNRVVLYDPVTHFD